MVSIAPAVPATLVAGSPVSVPSVELDE